MLAPWFDRCEAFVVVAGNRVLRGLLAEEDLGREGPPGWTVCPWATVAANSEGVLDSRTLPGYSYESSTAPSRATRRRARPVRAHAQDSRSSRNGLDVLSAIAERRHLDREDAQPVVEVLAEEALRHRARQVPVGRRDDRAVVDRDWLGRRRARRSAPGARAAASPAGAWARPPPRRGRACRRWPPRTAYADRAPRR